MSTLAEYGWKLWEIPPIWKGQTVACIAPGPSLDEDEVRYCYDSGYKIIAVNDAYKLAPFADILYACDWWWWNKHDCARDYAGVRVGLGWDFVKEMPITGWAASKEAKEINLIGMTGCDGLEMKNRYAVRTGGNSGYQAVNLAAQMGARNIFLLGYDMKATDGKSHFWGNYEKRTPGQNNFKEWIKNFKTIAEPLVKSGVRVVNCNPDSALKVFKKTKLEID